MFQDVPGCSGMFHVPSFLYVYEKRSATCNMQSSRSYRVVSNMEETPDIQETRDMTVIDTSTSFYLGVNKMNNCTKQHICESKTHETKMADFDLRLIPGSFIGQNVLPLSPSSKTFLKTTEHS